MPSSCLRHSGSSSGLPLTHLRRLGPTDAIYHADSFKLHRDARSKLVMATLCYAGQVLSRLGDGAPPETLRLRVWWSKCKRRKRMCGFYSITLPVPVTVVLIVTFALAWLRKRNHLSLITYTEPSHLAVFSSFKLDAHNASRY
jgi:hypothetical protein